MANPDELTRVGMEIVVQGTQLTGEVILKVLESLRDLFEKKENDNRDFIINDNTKVGKQTIKDLIKKHKEGVVAIDDNVTKEQMNDYAKEFKKLGVDFSVVKNEKDNFSFFFASKDANVIEKALKNVVEKKSKTIDANKEKRTEKETEHDSLVELDSEKIKGSLNELRTKGEQLENIYKQLTPEEKELFIQLNNVKIESMDNLTMGQTNSKQSGKYDEISKSMSEESKNKVNKIYNDNIHTNTGKAPKGKIHMDELSTVNKYFSKDKKNQLQNPEGNRIENTKNRPQKFSLNAVKEIDAKLKENETKNADKKRSKELSRWYFKVSSIITK